MFAVAALVVAVAAVAVAAVAVVPAYVAAPSPQEISGVVAASPVAAITEKPRFPTAIETATSFPLLLAYAAFLVWLVH
ncbi:hypothetical protein J7643_04005 [bacterium]|nr:hypothetical protein [bacterium]